jgi:hypothetical protein
MTKLIVYTLVCCGTLSAQPTQDEHPEAAAFEKFCADLASLTTANPTSQLKQRLADDIMVLAEKPHQPPRTLVQWFANDLASALAGKRVTNQKLFRQLAADIQKTLQSAGTSTSGFHETVNQAETVLIALGLNTLQANGLARKLKAIGDRVRGPEDIPVMDAP